MCSHIEQTPHAVCVHADRSVDVGALEEVRRADFPFLQQRCGGDQTGIVSKIEPTLEHEPFCLGKFRDRLSFLDGPAKWFLAKDMFPRL